MLTFHLMSRESMPKMSGFIPRGRFLKARTHRNCEFPAGPFGRGVQIDAVTLLTVFSIFLWLIPQQWVVPGGGAIARPAILVGVGIASVYVAMRFIPSLVPTGRNPVAFGLWVYGLIVMVSFGLSYNRDQIPAEVAAGRRAIIFTIAIVGVGLMTSGSISSQERLEVLLRRIVTLASIVAVLALLQFYVGLDLPARIKIPGLELHGVFLTRSRPRNGLTRTTGTAAHAIELAVVMAMVLPLALHYALHERNRTRRRFFWLSVILIAATVPTTVSRSGVLAVTVSVGLLSLTWSWYVLRRMSIAGVFAVLFSRLTTPALLRTIKGLFIGLGSDRSIIDRTSDYNTAFAFISQRPLFGRGVGTWSAGPYILLDNQMLLSLLEIGWVGVIGISIMYILGASAARSVRIHSGNDVTKHLGQALFGSILAGFVSLFFVDAFFYEIYMGTTAILIGAAGALKRMISESSTRLEAVPYSCEVNILSRRLCVDAKPRWWALALRDDMKH